MTHYVTTTGKTITLGTKIGTGGEGTVYNITGATQLVAKIYHTNRTNTALAAKVRAMVDNPPDDTTRTSLNHVSIAWPTDVILCNGQFVGYVMPKLPKSYDLYELINPQQRQKKHGHFDHRHLYRVARNLAYAMDAIHSKNYVIGDVNFKNALFNNQSLITLVDCDSMQVQASNGTIYRCTVSMPEYTPPELQGKDLNQEVRTPNHDAFGLAVLIFQLLMQGFHPFTGRAKPGTPDREQAHVYCIQHQIFPYCNQQTYEPPKVAPRFDALPPTLQGMFVRAFTQIHNRPTPKEWVQAILLIEKRLVQCTQDTHHYYPRDGTCVICTITNNTQRLQITKTPAASPRPLQVQLTPAGTVPFTAPQLGTQTAQPNSPLSSSNPMKHIVWMIGIFIAIALCVTPTKNIIYTVTDLWNTIFGTGNASTVNYATDTSFGDPAITIKPSATIIKNRATAQPIVKDDTTSAAQGGVSVRPTEEVIQTPNLWIRKNDGADAVHCISMQISGIDALYWRLIARGSPLEPAVFDGAGNARLCDPTDGPAWIAVQDGFQIDVLNPNFDPVPGGSAPAKGGDIFVAVWQP